jgi:DNA-binding MarR family transcriptional regulator
MTDDAPMSEMPGHLIRRLHQHATSVFLDRVRGLGHDVTSVQFAVLSVLANNADLDQASLAKRIACDPATIGGVINRLEQKGLVERKIDVDDRRAFKLRLSCAGKSLVGTLKPVVVSLQDEILLNLTDKEKADLIQLMKKALGMSAVTDESA